MKKRMLFLDFTSLLDVIMILLFFFIIFSELETDELVRDVNEQQSQLASQKYELDAKLNDADELLSEAGKKLDNAQALLDEANIAVEHSGENVKAISEFSENKNIKLNLIMKPETDSWELAILREGEQIGVIEKASVSALTNSLKQVFLDCGYSVDNTILIELFIDETENGTNSAYWDIEDMFTQIREEYPHCYFSETDKSMI